MPQFFDVAAAKRDGMSDDEINRVMKQMGLKAKPAETTAPPATQSAQPQGMSAADAVAPPPAPVVQEQPQQEQSLLSKVGTGAVDFFKGMFAAPAKLGKALGGAAGMVATEGQFQDTQKQYMDIANTYTNKGVELNKAGKKDEARKMFQLAQETIAKAQADADARIGEAEQGKKDVVKGGVGTAAFFVPGGVAGKGLVPAATRVGSGMLAGGMSGFGTSEEGQELESTAGGAVVGGVLTGALELAGAGLSKLKASRAAKAASSATVPKVDEKILNPQVRASAYYSQNKEQLVKTANDLGLTGTADDMLDQIGSHADRANKQIQSMLKTAPEMDGNKIGDIFIEQVDNNTNFVPGDKAWEKQFAQTAKRVEKLGVNPRPEEVYKLKSDLRGELDKTFTKLAKGNENLTPMEETKLALFYSLKDSLDTVSPEIRTINNVQHTMDDLAQGLVKSANKDGNVVFKLPVGGDVPLPVTKQKLSTTAGAAAQNLGGKAVATAKAVDKGITAVDQALGQTGRNVVIANTVDAMGNPTQPAPTEQQTSTTPADQLGMEAASATAQTPDTSGTVTGYTVEQLGQALTAATLAQDKQAVSELKTLYALEQQYQKDHKKTATATKAERLNDVLGKSLDQMEKLYFTDKGDLSAGATTTGVGGVVSKANQARKKAFSQDFNDRLESYNQMKTLAIGIINKAREAGVLNAGEFEQMMAATPNENTSKKVAQDWFKNVKELLTNSPLTYEQGMTAEEAVLQLTEE